VGEKGGKKCGSRPPFSVEYRLAKTNQARRLPRRE
jgi:hypothetical protein